MNFAIDNAIQVANCLRTKGEIEGAEVIEDLIRFITVPVAVSEDLDLAKHDGAVAWHLIERHAVNWADVNDLMERWFQAETIKRRAGRGYAG